MNRQPSDDILPILEEDIIFGRLRPRERLVEDEMMTRFNVKRHVVRQALMRLESMGLVTRAPNKGALVRDFSLDELEQIYEMRDLLQERAVERMPLPGSPELVDQLRRIQTDHQAAVEAWDLPAIYRLNNDFHEALFGACGNKHLADAIEHYTWLAHAVRSYRMINRELLADAPKEHAQMVDALEAGDKEQLKQLCQDHILPSKDAYRSARQAIEPPAAPDRSLAADG
ncbi:MAG: GntR family transcriptional regulator [Hyphomicrobiaceae bacterium]